MPVKIPEGFAEKIDRYGPHFIKVERAEPGVKRSGKKPVEKDWQLNPMKSGDPKLLAHLKSGGNYGIVLSSPIYALDLDEEALLEQLLENGLPRTFAVLSGSGGGFHLYLTGDIKENGQIFDIEGKNVGNIQVRHKQVVGPGSIHNSGGTYKIIHDYELKWVTKDELNEILKHTEYTISWSYERRASEDSAEKETELVGDRIPIAKVVPMGGLRSAGVGEWQGSHPVHGSDTGHNFSVSEDLNCWHCFRCGTGGGPLSWFLVAAGEMRCEEAVPGKLRGALFRKALKLAKEAGFEIDQAENPWEEEDFGFELIKGVTFKKCLDTVKDNFPGLEFAYEVMMSSLMVQILDTNKPLAMVLVGVSGSGKTTLMDMLFPFSKYTLRVDLFTAASFVTQKSEKAEENELGEIDFLPRIKDKILITPELAPIFSQSEDALRQTIGVVTRILDGQGYVRAAGTHGLRGYKEDFKFTWIGGTVPFSWRVWRVMGEFGPRMYFIGMPNERPTSMELVMARIRGKYADKVERCRVLTWSFIWEQFNNGVVKWDVAKDDKKLMDKIAKFAELLTRLRAQTILKDMGGGEYKYWSPRIELPYKPFHALYDIARGHAILNGRRRLDETDLAQAANVALNSAPDERVRQFKILLEEGEITNAILADRLNCSISTAQRTTTELLIVGLIERGGKDETGQRGRYAGKFTLAKELQWFLSKDFDVLRKKLEIRIQPSGVFQAIKKGQTTEEANENWLNEYGEWKKFEE